MDFRTYEAAALTTLAGEHALSEQMTPMLISQVLGLSGETGEITEKFKKLIRDKHGVISEEDKKEILKELGDVLWYINSISHLLGGSIEDVAQANLEKLKSRKERGVLAGSGDNR